MNRLPTLGSLRSLATYGADEVDSDDEEIARKKAKVLVARVASDDENQESRDGGSDLDIVMSDEENDSSRSGSIESRIVVTQPRVNIASKLVSYGGDEDEDEDITKSKENDDAPEIELPETFAPEPSSKENEEKNQVKTSNEETKSFSSVPVKDTTEGTIPKELRVHLAAVSAIQVTLPEEPDGRCSNSLQEKIENLLEKKVKSGRDFNVSIQRKKNFRNPSIYDKLVSFCSINETGTNYPPHIYDPFSWTEESFYESLTKLQKEHYDKKQKERSKVEFISAIKKSVVSADEAAKKRKSKWDVTSSGTASMLLPPIATQSIVSVQAVVAAKAKVINTIATIQAKQAQS